VQNDNCKEVKFWIFKGKFLETSFFGGLDTLMGFLKKVYLSALG